MTYYDEGKPLYPPTPRQLEVLQWLAEGCHTRDVARHLGTSPRTSKSQLHELYPRLGVKNEVEAVVVGLQHGLIQFPNRGTKRLPSLYGQPTPRQLEILHLLAEGYTETHIGWRLGIKKHTVTNHVYDLKPRLGAENIIDAVVIALQHGLIRFPKKVQLPQWKALPNTTLGYLKKRRSKG